MSVLAVFLPLVAWVLATVFVARYFERNLHHWKFPPR